MTLVELMTEKHLDTREAFDILTSLAMLIENGVCDGIAPENIEVKPNFEVEIKNDYPHDNAYFMAPEQLFSGENPSKNCAWFSFGLIYYYVLTSKIWYIAQSVKLYELVHTDMLIVPPDSHFADINKLLSNNPDERTEGLHAFLKQAETYPKGKVMVNYVHNNETVHCETFQFVRELDDYGYGKKIKAANGNTYVVNEHVNILSRFTDQVVSIPVAFHKSADADIDELRMQIGNDFDNRVTLFELDDSDEAIRYPISLGKIKSVIFWKTKVNSYGNKLNDTKLREINMPRVCQEAALGVRFDSKKATVYVSLLNGSQQPREIRFKIPAE